jgi:magnesium transporter
MAQPEALQRLEELIDQFNESEKPRPDLIHTLKEFRSIDIAAVFHHFRRGIQEEIFTAFDDEMAAEVLVELDDILAIDLLKDLNTERIASILNYLPPDEGADVIALSEEEDQPQILTQVDHDLADRIRDLATYEPESAGGLMTSHFFSVSAGESVRSVLLKVKTSEEAETINHIYVINGQGRIEGVMSVRELLSADLSQVMSDIMERDVISVPLNMDQEEVFKIANKYHLSSIPVVDEGRMLKGIITFDDLMEVIEEESSEDMYRMAGEVALHPTQQPIIRRIMARFPWLLVTLCGTLLAAGLIKAFESVWASGESFGSLTSVGDLIRLASKEIENEWTFLLCFLPMIMGMAGNVGLQSSTVMVRGLATGEVEPPFFIRILGKEVLISMLIGLLSGLIIFVIILMIYKDLNMGTAVGLSLLSAILSAAVLGTLMPFLCLVIKVDPAYASGPLITTMNDLIAILISFGIAYSVLRG